jgi:hypothetical protein
MHPAFASVVVDLDELDHELQMLRAAEAADLKSLSGGDPVQRWISTTSRASAVESLFTGMERVLKRILSIMGEDVFEAKQDRSHHQFHRQLIAQSAISYRARPPVISTGLRDKMDELRKFRHFERNSYGHSLESDRVTDVVDLAIATTDMFERELRVFMMSASTAMESGDGDMA